MNFFILLIYARRFKQNITVHVNAQLQITEHFVQSGNEILLFPTAKLKNSREVSQKKKLKPELPYDQQLHPQHIQKSKNEFVKISTPHYLQWPRHGNNQSVNQTNECTKKMQNVFIQWNTTQ